VYQVELEYYDIMHPNAIHYYLLLSAGCCRYRLSLIAWLEQGWRLESSCKKSYHHNNHQRKLREKSKYHEIKPFYTTFNSSKTFCVRSPSYKTTRNDIKKHFLIFNRYGSIALHTLYYLLLTSTHD